MSKIIVRRQEYANNGTHANEIESVVKDNLIVNTLSSALDVAPSVGLLKDLTDVITLGTITYNGVPFTFRKIGNLMFVRADGQLTAALPTSWANIGTLDISTGLNYNTYAVLISNEDFFVHLRVNGRSVDIYAKTSQSTVYIQSTSILA